MLCYVMFTLRAKLSGEVYCYRSCLCVCNGRAGGRCLCVWVCCHDNSKLRGSILTKLGLYIQLIKFWPSCAPGKGVCMQRGEIFWLCVTTASAQCLRLSERFFHIGRPLIRRDEDLA